MKTVRIRRRTSRRQGKWTYYAISAEGSHYAKELLARLTEVNPAGKSVSAK
jgi:DNA-binding transcriptional ArsR family regulator